jgi:hypothetical protein
MEISKIIGTIENRIRDNAQIKVYGFKINGAYVLNEEEILKEFKPKGFVFSPGFFGRHFDFQIGDLIEIYIQEIEYSENTLRDSSVIDTGCKHFGFPIYKFNPTAFVNSKSIDTTQLKLHVENIIFEYYIYDTNYLYGPFKKENDQVIPKIGSDVSKFKINKIIIINSNDNHFILKKPEISEKVCDIDCMTSTQIVKWLKERLKPLKIELNYDEIRNKLFELNLHGLDQARFHKATKYINKIKLNYNDIKSLKDIQDFRDKYESALAECKSEMKNEFESEYLNDILEQKENLKKEISLLKVETEKANKNNKIIVKNTEQFKIDYEKCKADLDFILKEKERIINDIKIHSSVSNKESSNKINNLVTYEVQEFYQQVNPFQDLNSFLENIKDLTSDTRLSSRCIYQMKEFRCLLSDSIEYILQIAKATNNCKVFIQQIEPDWLKFEKFYENGLKQAWQSAHHEIDKIHFLILEDINMSSIECFGKPILDLIAGIRKTLPGESNSWPSNLWIFGIPIETKEEQAFGLPLLKRTYSHWGAFPKLPSDQIFNQVNSNHILNPNALNAHNSHDAMPSSNISEYFD